MTLRLIPRATFRTAARKAAWLERDEHGRPVGLVLHSRIGGIGADWPLFRVYDAIDTAENVCWSPGLLGHDLCVVQPGGRVVRFDVPMPAGAVTE